MGLLWLCRYDDGSATVQVRQSTASTWAVAATLAPGTVADVDLVEESDHALVLTVLIDDQVTLYRSRDNGIVWEAV
jgi:hypothetical protein